MTVAALAEMQNQSTISGWRDLDAVSCTSDPKCGRDEEPDNDNDHGSCGNMSRIKAIDHNSAHRIHSGQVVLDLQGAIKELVENSLDAGATTIDVRFKNQGLDSIEVLDNGSGIAEEDWPSIGLKHHTSKLPSLADLPHVTTFGFRGEALSSLCALCESITIVTSTKQTEPMGAVIHLGRDGKVIDSEGRIARPRGTTVTLNGLFVPLPVRRKEFERTIKREFPKALTMLQAYALVPAATVTKPGVRLKVETVASKGKRNVMLATDGRGSLRSSVISVWGPKALEGVLDLDLELQVSVDPVMARREGLDVQSQSVKVSGLISSASWGQGRSSTDRQFFYINQRPCDLKQVGRAINEVYKSYNTHQVPLAVLDFQLPPESIDINVSPDKRTIFLHSEANFIAALQLPFRETQTSPDVPNAVNEPTEGDLSQAVGDHIQTPSDAPTRLCPDVGDILFEGEIDATPAKSSRQTSHRSTSPLQIPTRRGVSQTLNTTGASWSPDRTKSVAKGKTAVKSLKNRLAAFASQSSHMSSSSEDESDDGLNDEEPAEETEDAMNHDIIDATGPDSGSGSELDVERPSRTPLAKRPAPDILSIDMSTPEDIPIYKGEITTTVIPGEMTLRFDVARVKRRYSSYGRRRPRRAYNSEWSISSAAGIKNHDPVQAEEALARVISKSDFARMQVLGQFNKGFIIARLGSSQGVSDDLFIIDQHACDEKYNFETLQRTTVIKAQTLIRPRPLQLTAGDEMVAIENMDVLKANGFEVLVDEDKAPGRGERISLSAMPVSRETTFDFKDLEQLLHMLSDGARPAGQMVRCSKARSMFAMRACRRSVMIGKSLTKPQMTQLLRNMGTIDQPWNCPHGRPTMRHLTKVPMTVEGSDRIDWSRWDSHHG
ncbi:hypothetical protein BD324DRAFT_642703 [Kockovaella imperatae]|uniref:DNA mismatch repair protein PMS1 n=1 Tax=Kockovaella imperatae TaxID=4999 RepID=A0A1Y1UD90_9TREE|nr:hypothetical protein BD324DRAFT_642703 [Kockovaella imperatae]ORX36000.1 hypothetical protein BD324DRAFT_642703 [Kockovaella imperatae]